MRSKKKGRRNEDRFIAVLVATPIILLSHLIIGCLSFNLDPRIPVIKSAGVHPDSYFGYSVAQHRIVKDAWDQTRILVGAPRDENLQPGTNRSGALYACTMSNAIEDCIQIPTDGKRSISLSNGTYGVYDGSLTRLNPPVTSELKDGQWLGVQVASQGEGGKVIVCAHRYGVRDVEKFNRYRPIDSKRGMLGLCYILSPDLTLPRNDEVGYKNVIAVRDAMGGKRLQPLGVAFDDHAQWGVCQLGAAAVFVRKEDLEAGDENLALFGAPGCFAWRGNVFGQSVGSLRRYDVAVNGETKQTFAKHGHMGLSVTSGRFFHGYVSYASGAPHAGEKDSRTGEIYFFRRDPANNLFVPEEDKTLRGEAFGAGFGYSLATLDANGDASSDLLVGAPFYDGGKTGRGGAIYVYLSKRGALQRKSIKILGKELESQFGLAIATLGDLNKDGFDDFAVGAPYENSGSGVVYVFFGGPQGIRAFKPSAFKGNFLPAEEVADQIITATQLSKNLPHILPATLATFGSSLSGGTDMDNNGYPDLLVGAYQSNYVFLLRARPIIDIRTFVDESNLKGIDPGQSGCAEDIDSEETCFSFKTCFNVDEEVSQNGLFLNITIEAEPKKPVSRVWLRLKKDSRSARRNNVVMDTITIQRRSDEYCTEVVGYVSTHADLQTPVQFAMTYSLIQDEPRMEYRRGASLPFINDFPILNQAQARKRFQATFEKDCGLDEICQSQLILYPTLWNNSVELRKTPGGHYELELGSLDGNELLLDLIVDNAGDPAYEAEVDIHFPADLSYIGLGKEYSLNSPTLRNETWLRIDLGNPFKGKKEDELKPNSQHIQLRFSPKIGIEERLIQFFITANTSSVQEMDPSTYVNVMIVRRAEVKLLSAGFPKEVHYGGPTEVRGESAFSEQTEIGPQVVHRFLVMNNGPSDLDVLTVTIDWPHQVENGKNQGKWLLYLTDHPLLKDGRGDCVLPGNYKANPLNLTSPVYDGITYRHAPQTLVLEDQLDLFNFSNELERQRRPKREVEKVIRPQVRLKENGEEMSVVTFDCDRGTAKCLKITCQMIALPAGVSATIEIRARVWNSTLAEDYSGLNNVDMVEIFSKAKVTVDPVITQDISDDYVSVRTVAIPDGRQMLGATPRPSWWIILVSVLIGLLVLVIISLILWKIGFFKRKRPIEEDDTDFMMSAHFEKVHLNGST